MATEIVYADLELGQGQRCGGRLEPPEPGSPGCPRWHRVALGAGWTGTVLLGVAVVALGCSFLLRQPENQGSCRIGNGNVGNETSCQENDILRLREALCLSQPQAAQGCRICPQGWTQGSTKCYWISTKYSHWKKSRDYCKSQGATLLVLQDQEELVSLNDTLQKSRRNIWIGLWLPEAGKGWTWVNGSSLDQNQFHLDLKEQPGECGILRGSRIMPYNCSLELPWICQREATKL